MISTLLIPWVPALTIWFALVLQELALPFAAWSVLRPDLVVICLFYWRLYRPDLCGPVLAFSVGLLLDMLTATPLGLNAFSKVVLVLVVGHYAMRLRAAAFIYHLPVILLLVAMEMVIQLAFFSLLWEGAFFAALFVGRPVATMLVMPAVVFLLIHIHKSWLEYA